MSIKSLTRTSVNGFNAVATVATGQPGDARFLCWVVNNCRRVEVTTVNGFRFYRLTLNKINLAALLEQFKVEGGVPCAV
jgi:hypothetical protein